MEKITKFFSKKKIEMKFARLGEGQRLGDLHSPPHSPPRARESISTSNSELSPTSHKAAEAAMARLNVRSCKPERSKPSVKHEVVAARAAVVEAEQSRERFVQKVVHQEKPQALGNVLFWCPKVFGDTVVGSRAELDKAIFDYLQSESTCNQAEASALLLVRGIELSKPPVPPPDVPANELPTATEVREKRKQNFNKILTNLMQAPTNPTFRRLRLKNRLVEDLLSVDGAEGFFLACNFCKENCSTEGLDTPLEPYLVISEENAKQTTHLEHMFELLNTAEPLLAELYRDTKVFVATGQSAMMVSRDQLPEEFFCQTKDEVKRSLEHQQRLIEESNMLLTKAMRERLRVQEVRLFRYALLRIRFPSNYILQGTFYANDCLSIVRSWICECLENPGITFQLWAPPGTTSLQRGNAPMTARVELNQFTSTLIDLGLAPCSLLAFVATSEQSAASSNSLIRKDLLELAKPL